MVAVKRSGMGHGEIRIEGENESIEGRSSPALITPDAPRTAPLPKTNEPLGASPSGGGGFMHRIGEINRRHRGGIAAALMGLLILPGLGAATTAKADPIHATPAAVTDTAGRTDTASTPARAPGAHKPYVRPHHFNHTGGVTSNPFSAVQDVNQKFELLKIKAAALEDSASTMSADDLQAARQKLFTDYQAGGGTVGVSRGIPPNEMVAYKVAFALPTQDISVRNVTDFALFKFFWETEGSDGVGLARHGLDEVTPQGVEKLVAYVKTHNLDGSDKTKPELQRIDPDQRAVMRAIIEHPRFGQYFEVDARPVLMKAFGFNASSVNMPGVINLHPEKAGNISIPHVTTSGSINSASIASLPQLMQEEYNARKAYFEDPSVSVEERGLRTLGLLKDYADAMWTHGERPETENTGYALLDAFVKLPYAAVHGTKDFNGAGWNVAQSLVLGMDPNKFETRFPDANVDAPNTYLAMHGEMVESMKFVDAYRVAKGDAPGAQAFEKKSPLGWMLGEESGHSKAGNLDENKPFSSSGLNWGVLIFPGDDQIKNLPVKEGFEFPIDCIDGFNNAVTARPSWGDRIEIRDQNGVALKVEKQIQTDAQGKPVSWSAIFRDKNGHEVDPSKVLGVILNAQGQVKGDGKATRTLDMWWWGFCDRNTAQRLYKSEYGIPQLDRDVKLVVNGKTIVVPKDDGQKLIDMDIPDLVPYETMEAFRFNDNPQVVKLKDGETISAHVRDLAMDAGPGVKRVGGDIIAIYDAPGRPMLGTLEIQENDNSAKPFGVDVRYVDRITKNADGTVTVKMNDDYEGYNQEVTGKLLTQVKWAEAKVIDGKTVLVQNEDDYPIRGAFTLELLDGSLRRVNASEVSQITGETQHDVRLSQFTKWVADNKGIFATDGDPGVVVSNGARIVNKIDVVQQFGDVRPDFAPKKARLLGIDGYLKREAGDKILWIRALYGSKGEEPTTSLYEGWVQVSKEGRILNEGFTQGQPDFGWAGYGKLNWLARSTFNPYMDPEMRLRIFVNGVTDQTKLQKMADQGNLPQNWRTYLTPPN